MIAISKSKRIGGTCFVLISYLYKEFIYEWYFRKIIYFDCEDHGLKIDTWYPFNMLLYQLILILFFLVLKVYSSIFL